MDVAGSEARCEHAEGGHQTTAVHAEQLVLVSDSQLDGVCRLDTRDEVVTALRSAEQFPSEPVARARFVQWHTAHLTPQHRLLCHLG